MAGWEGGRGGGRGLVPQAFGKELSLYGHIICACSSGVEVGRTQDVCGKEDTRMG